VDVDDHAQRTIEAVALLLGEIVQLLGCESYEALQEGVPVALEFGDAAGSSLNFLQRSLGGAAGLFQVGQLLPQLIEGDELLGRHLLIPGALAVHLGELLQQRFCFLFGTAPQRRAVHLDHRVHAGPQPVGVTQQVADFLPHLLLELLCTVIFGVSRPFFQVIHRKDS
jgi:hypothetical protein